jgi:NAD(P)H dehydrogenase (quinone)
MNSLIDSSPPTLSLSRVLVTGATGNTGSALLNELSGSGIELVAALSREDAKSRIPESCSYRLCDYDNAAQVGAALAGMDAVFLLLPFDQMMVRWGEQFVEQARQQGVRFIVRLSGLLAAQDCSSKMGRLHGQIDESVKRSGIQYCILRCNSFMQNFAGVYRSMIRRGTLSLPEGDARSGFIDTADIAAVVAHIIKNPGQHINRVYDLSGPEALSNKQAVEIISEVIGTPILYRAMSEAEVRRVYEKFGISSWSSEVLESLSRFIRRGYAGNVTDTVEKLLGRPPRTFRDFVERNRQCWANVG